MRSPSIGTTGCGLRVAQRFARVKLEEVDRFGNVAVGLRPTLADFVDQQRVVFEAPFAQQLGGLEEIGGPLGQRKLPPRFERARRCLDRLVRLLLRRRARNADDLVGVGRIERADLLLRFDLAAADDERIVLAELARAPSRARPSLPPRRRDRENP